MEINIRQIIKGHLNELLGKEDELSAARFEHCNRCPLLDQTIAGPVCSAKKFWNRISKKVETLPCPSCISGCGCRLDAKTRTRGEKCPLGKW